MSILRFLELPFSENHSKINLPTKKGRLNNRVTVIIGENGTRKSYLLRHILDRATNQLSVNEELMEEHLGANFLAKPSKIIAISSAPTDRFPSKPAASDRFRSSRYDVPYYTYIGPRTAGNILSRNQSVDGVINAILKNPEVVEKRSDFLFKIHEQLELDPNYAIGLDFSTAARKNGSSIGIDVYEYIDRRKKEAEKGSISRKLENILAIEEFSNSNEGKELVSLLRHGLNTKRRPKPHSSAIDFPFCIYLNTLSGGLDTNIGGSTEALRWAMEIGYIRPGRLDFRRKNGREINQDELSAGQWSLFSTMTSLALSTSDGSLILIDEPESGLHPTWQRTFLDLFTQAISHAKNCHAVIATHSPLILSSLNPETGDLICLTRDSSTDEICAEIGQLPLGWDTSLILQDMFELDDARAPKLTELVDKALALIARGIRGNEGKLNTLITQLQPYYDSLPEEDIGKGVITSIMKVARKASPK